MRARKTPSLEERIDRLSDLRADPAAPHVRPELSKALSSRISLLAAKAARLAGEFRITELIPQLEEAFERFLLQPETSDKGCAAKIEIVKALDALGHEDPGVYLRGLHHVQREPSWGGPVDTAAALRAASALALARTSYPYVMEEFADLLADREPPARIGAVRAIASTGKREGVLLLRLKVRSGDRPDIVGECFTALLAMTPRQSLPLVAGYLDHQDQAIAEAAALALGESREEGAFELLRDALPKTATAGMRKTLLISIALLRREEAIGFLLKTLAESQGQLASAAVGALAVYRDDDRIRRKVHAAIAGRESLAAQWRHECQER